MDAAIARATWSVLAQCGYGGLSFDAVAKAAGCSRPAVYRRFANKRDLVLASIEAASRPLREARRTISDPRRRLVEHACGLAAYYGSPFAGAATLALMQASRSDPELHAVLQDLTDRKRPQFEEAVGEILQDTVPAPHLGLLFDALVGAIFFRVVVQGLQLERPDVEFLVDGVLMAAARREDRPALDLVIVHDAARPDPTDGAGG